MSEENKSTPVFVDFKALREEREKDLGRSLTTVEESILSEADAIRIDALACGRTVATTVGNIENYGSKVSEAVKSFLGLIPPVN